VAQSQPIPSTSARPASTGARRAWCKDCGSGYCQHGRQKSRCRDCGTGHCQQHGRQKAHCPLQGLRHTAMWLRASTANADLSDSTTDRRGLPLPLPPGVMHWSALALAVQQERGQQHSSSYFVCIYPYHGLVQGSTVSPAAGGPARARCLPLQH
jgi:hypothetical protein